MTGSFRSFRNPASARAFALVAGFAVLAVGSARAVATGIDWSAHADTRTVVIVNADEDGSRRETTIWLCVSDGQGYVRGGSGRWVGNTLRNGDVTLQVGETELAVRATKRAIHRGLDLHIRDAARAWRC